MNLFEILETHRDLDTRDVNVPHAPGSRTSREAASILGSSGAAKGSNP